MTPPIPLSQWADQQGIPRRTAYNWAKSGRLNIPLHRTLTGRLMVLTDDDDAQAEGQVHPFVQAYAEALNLPVGVHDGDHHYSAVLEGWGVDLYDAVEADLRPVVLHLALPAACRRPKRDAMWRLADWLGRVELADWYDATGIPRAAAMVRARPAIVDVDTFWEVWPTAVHSFDWRSELDDLVREHLKAAGTLDRFGEGAGAAESLAENSLIGLDEVAIAGRRPSFRSFIDKHARDRSGDRTVAVLGPDRSEMWDIRALYADPMWAVARPAARVTARTICALVGQDPTGPTPADGHPLHEIGYPACRATAIAALTPYAHAAHLREIDAFRRIALGVPFDPSPGAPGRAA